MRTKELQNKIEEMDPGLEVHSKPYNPSTKSYYIDKNSSILSKSKEKNEFNSNEWATYDQWKKAGRCVLKGEKVTFINYRQIEGEVKACTQLFNKDQTKEKGDYKWYPSKNVWDELSI